MKEFVLVLIVLFFAITGAAVWQRFLEMAANGKPF